MKIFGVVSLQHSTFSAVDSCGWIVSVSIPPHVTDIPVSQLQCCVNRSFDRWKTALLIVAKDVLGLGKGRESAAYDG